MRAEAKTLVTEWKHLLRTNPKIGLTGTTFIQTLVEKQYSLDFLMTTNSDGARVLPTPLEIEANAFPMLKLLIQDNFLTVLLVLITRQTQLWDKL